MWRDTWLIAANGLRRSVRDRSILIQALVAPIVIAVVVGAAFGAGFTLNVTIGIADADRSEVSKQIADGLAGGGGDGIAFSTVTGDDVDAMVDSGVYDAIIVLPAGLSDAVLAGDPAQLDVVGRATDPLAQSVAESVAAGIAANLQTARITAVAATQVGVTDVGAAIQQAVSAPSPITVQQGEVSRHVLRHGLLRARHRDALPVLHHRQRGPLDHRRARRGHAAADPRRTGGPRPVPPARPESAVTCPHCVPR